jgi:hypothetical protein
MAMLDWVLLGCLVTTALLPTGPGLGQLKLEYTMKTAVFIKPKMYSFSTGTEDKCRIKGMPPACIIPITGDRDKKPTFQDFRRFLENPYSEFTRFSKFKESLRHDRGFNEEYLTHKAYALEDNKRAWPGDIALDAMQDSCPLEIIDGILSNKRIIMLEKAERAHRKAIDKGWKEYFNSNLFDKDSVGSDISYREFMRNEYPGT